MLNVLKRLKFAAFVMLLTAQNASADLLFSNFAGDPSANALYTAGGPCSFASCFAVGDNFSNDALWHVTNFTFYIASALPVETVGSGSRWALFTGAGTQVVAPTDVAPTVTDTGLTGANDTHIFKFEISGLNIDLVPGQYQLRFTNAGVQGQDVYPGLGNASAQTIDPGFFQLTGSQSVESLLSTDVTPRTENWAFHVSGTSDKVFSSGFEAP